MGKFLQCCLELATGLRGELADLISPHRSCKSQLARQPPARPAVGHSPRLRSAADCGSVRLPGCTATRVLAVGRHCLPPRQGLGKDIPQHPQVTLVLVLFLFFHLS